jgi:site-specific DNA recombinase
MIAAIYARKSADQSGVSDEQKSVARQVEHARQYAERKGWSIAEDHVYVDDGISGAEFERRPGYVALMRSLDTKPRRAPFNALIISDLDRLGREQMELGYALKQISEAGVRIFSYLEDREIALDNPIAVLMMQVQSFAASMEREKARVRTYDALIRKARAGHVADGRVFGYDNQEVLGADGKRSHVERRINPAEAAVVREVFERYAAGEGMRRIAHSLNARKVPSPRAQQGRSARYAPC